MTRPARTSRGAPAATATASAAAASRIDNFGRVSKRVAPSSGKKATATTTDSSAARLDAIARLFVDQKQEEHATKLDAVVEVPSRDIATPTKKSKKTKKAATPAATTATTSTTTPCPQRKRRATEALDACPSSSPAAAQPTPTKRARKVKQATTSVAELLARAADKAGKKASASSSLQTATPVDSDSDTPSQTAGHLIAQLNINTSFSASSSFARLRSTSASPRPASTAPTTPCESDNESEPRKTFTYSAAAPLPFDLSELVRLHSAFSKALAVHHAHHGPSAPIDTRALCPTVAQSWGKRKVVLEDIQRCLGVAMSGAIAAAGSKSIVNALFLSDYTRGKICIELKPDVFSNAAAIGTLADQLNTAFETNLRALWAQAPHARATATSAEAKQFIATLPKAKVVKSSSLLQTSALRAKGQRTLEDLMHGIALKKQEKAAHEALLKAPIPATVQDSKADAMDVDADADTAAPATMAAPAAPAAPMNLLDRIRYRQMQRTQLAAAGLLTAATPAELERRAALSRAGDIAEVLSMLCTAASLRQSNRVSFGMAAVVTKIKDSLVRLPIAREEAAACVRLLAKEVSAEWIQIVSMGGREIVIMMANHVPSKADIQQRVQRLS